MREILLLRAMHRGAGVRLAGAHSGAALRRLRQPPIRAAGYIFLMQAGANRALRSLGAETVPVSTPSGLLLGVCTSGRRLLSDYRGSSGRVRRLARKAGSTGRGVMEAQQPGGRSQRLRMSCLLGAALIFGFTALPASSAPPLVDREKLAALELGPQEFTANLALAVLLVRRGEDDRTLEQAGEHLVRASRQIEEGDILTNVLPSAAREFECRCGPSAGRSDGCAPHEPR